MRSPRRWMEELYLLGHHQGTKFRSEAFDEIPVREHSGPMRSTVGVVIEFPKMWKLIDRPGIALEIADKLFILPALLERREADLLPSCRHAACRFSVRTAPWELPLSLASITCGADYLPRLRRCALPFAVFRAVVGSISRSMSRQRQICGSCAASDHQGSCPKQPARRPELHPRRGK